MKNFLQIVLKIFTSKAFLYTLLFLILLGFATLFWIYSPLLVFNDHYLFTQAYLRILALCILFIPPLFMLTYADIKDFFSEKVIKRRKEFGLLKTQTQEFLLKTKRNFFICIEDAKRTWKEIRIKKLPLVMVLGQEGAGKSSFINYAGLQYPISSALGSYKHHHLSTKNFSFYISKKGVLIDTEGSFFAFERFFKPQSTDEIAEDNPQKNKDYLLKKMIWNEFIAFLSKGYFYKKLNAIIYIVDIVKILNASKEEMEEGIYSLIKRIRECETHLNLKMPIYIVFTKLDLIEGMEEFLKLYTQNLNQKILGITFLKDFSFSSEALLKNFQELSNSIKYALMEKNANNSTIHAKRQSYLFYKQLDNLFAFAQEFLQRIHQENQKNRSFIRGVYFVSAYQENTPHNFMLTSTCSKYNIKSPIAQHRPNIKKQSYFVESLLEDVVFKDVALTQSILANPYKGISTALLGLLSIALMLFFTHFFITQAHQQELELQNSTPQIQKAIDDLQTRYPQSSIDQKSLYLQNLKNILSFYPQIFSPSSWSDYLKLQLAYKAFAPAKELFLQKSRDMLYLTLIPELEHLLGEEKNPKKLLEILFLYKSLIHQTYLNKDLLINWIKENWGLFEKYNINQEILQSYIQDLTQEPHSDFKENLQAVKEAKKQLQKTKRSERLYTLLLLKSSDFRGVYNLRTEIGGSFDEVFDLHATSYNIPQSYTKNGALDLLKNIDQSLDEVIEIDQWLLGEPRQEDEQATLCMDIIKLYAQEYAQTWQNFLETMKPKSFINANSGLGILLILGKTNNPIKGLIEVVSKNTSLLSGNDLINLAMNTAIPIADFKSIFGALADSFKPYHILAKEDSLLAQGISIYEQERKKDPLNSLAHTLPSNTKVMEKISEDIHAIYKTIIDFNSGTLSSQEKIFYALKKPSTPTDPFVILESDLHLLPTELAQYYNLIKTYAWNIIEKRGVRELDIVWNKELYMPFIEQIASLYPINPRSMTLLKTDSFKAFFGKQGVWDKFYSQYLSAILIKKADSYQVDPAYAKKLNFSNEFLNALTQILSISNDILDFNNNLNIKFSIQVIALSGDYGKLTISYNDKKIQYDHTLSSNLEFIADAFDENTKILITAFNYNGVPQQSIEFHGQWAWMQFIQYAQEQKNKYKIIFNKNPKLYFDFQIRNGGTSLHRAMKLLPYLKLPQNILK